MPHYVLLMKLTEKGTAVVEGAPEWIDAATDTWHQSGGTMLVFCATMGEYDFVAVGEAPTDERAAAFALALSRQGLVSTTTLRAFTRDDLVHTIDLMPVPAPPAPPEDKDRRNVAPPEDKDRRNVAPPEDGPRGNVKQPDEPPAPPRGSVKKPNEPPTPTPPPEEPPR